jgi:hypothetical protein
MPAISQKYDSAATVFSRRRLTLTTSVPRKYGNRPAALRSAMRIIFENAVDLQLTRSDVSVLQAIIASGVSVENVRQAIFARKITLARLAEVTPRTVFRSLKKFEELNLILRAEQTRLEDGSMEISKIFLTEQFIALLHLDKCQESTIGKTNPHQEKITSNNSCAAGSAPSAYCDSQGSAPMTTTADSGLSTQDLSHGLSHGSIYKKEQTKEQKTSVDNQSQATAPQKNAVQKTFIRVDGRSVAKELFWLIEEKRLTYGGLFLLQKMAKSIGQRLSDYVRLREARLRELLTQSDCFRYLRSLIIQNLDAKHLCALEERKTHQRKRAQQAKTAKEEQNDAYRAIDGKCYQAADAKHIFQIDARNNLLILLDRSCMKSFGTSRLTSAALRFIAQGKWLPYQSISQSEAIEKGQIFLNRVLRLKQARKEAGVPVFG